MKHLTRKCNLIRQRYVRATGRTQGLLFLALFGCLLSAGRPALSVSRQADRILFALDRWTASGAAIPTLALPDGYTLQNTPDKETGDWSAQGDVDVSAYPYLALMIPRIGREGGWSLTVSDTSPHVLHKYSPGFGLFVYDLRKTPGWTGTTRCRFRLTVQGPEGRQNFIHVAWIGVFRDPPDAASAMGSSQSVLESDRMNRAGVTVAPDKIILALKNDPAPEWVWGGALSKVTVDTDRFPFVEVDVRHLSPNGNWRIGVPGVTNGPQNRQAGVVAMNYRDQLTEGGVRDLDVQMICSGAGTRLEYTPIRFVPYPSLSQDLVARTEKAAGSASDAEQVCATGPFTLRYEPRNGLFRIRNRDGTASFTTRFLEMAGVDLTPPGRLSLHSTKSGSGEKCSFHSQVGSVDYAVEIETPSAAPGLLHWRVIATPLNPVHLASCGHELCYVGAPGSTATLRRIANQSWSSSGLAYVVAPGVGTALYFQDFTALNPLFEKCHVPPRFLVHAGARTLGCADPMDTRVTFAAGAPITLSDAWLYLSPKEPKTREEESTLFLQAQAAIYERLADRPATEWRDWQKLARLSLRDLYNPACWDEWEHKIYLQAYVGISGASPQFTAMQDVFGPLLAFQKLSGEGTDMVNRFRADLPDFWTPNRNSFRLFANDPKSNWTSLEQHLGIGKAALEGDAQAKAYCLKSADTFLRLARETGYRFQHFTDFNYADQKELIPLDNEYGGAFLLYMMQCYALSPEARFLDAAKKAADKIADWDFNVSRMAAWTGATCEGLARLYAATGEERYLRLSYIPLAGLIRNAWLWNCRYGYAHGYTTFGGLTSDASGVDYITPSDQHWVWGSLWRYYLLTEAQLPPDVRALVSELIRYAPQVAWYTYPPNLPPESLHKGKGFWNTVNHFELYLPVEDLNDGWRDNGSVGQMLYGAGAAFDFASEAYTPLPEGKALVYCELPLLHTEWNAAQKTATLRLGGVPQHAVKIEVQPNAKEHAAWAAEDLHAEFATAEHPEQFHALKTWVEEGKLRGEVPGGSTVRIGGFKLPAPPAPRAEMLFQERFDKGLERWESLTGGGETAWSIRLPGVLDAQQNGFLITRKAFPADKTISFRLRIPNSASFEICPVFWFGEGRFYQVQFAPGRIGLQRHDTDFSEIAPSTELHITPNVWHTVRIEVKGERLRVRIENELVLDRGVPNLPMASGRLGFRGYGVQLADITVTGAH